MTNENKQLNSRIVQCQKDMENCSSSAKDEIIDEYKERYEALFHRSKDCILIHDRKGKFIDVNKRILDLLGYSLEEINDLSLPDLFPPDQHNLIKEKTQLLFIKDTIDCSCKSILKCKNGELINADIEFSLILKKGNPYAIQQKIININKNVEHETLFMKNAGNVVENKETEVLLKEQTELLKIIFDHIPVMIIYFEVSGKVKIVNKEWEKVSGWSIEETIMHDNILAELCPYDQYREFISNYIKAPKETWTEFLITTKDGRVICTSWANIILSDGTCIGIGRDITEQKKVEKALYENEERLKLSLEGANEGLWDWNLQTGEVYLGNSCYTMLGYEPNEFPTSYENFMNLIHPNQVNDIDQVLKEYLDEKRSGFEIEFLMKTKNEGYRWILSRGKVFAKDENGNPVRMVGTQVDITERKRIENALHENEQRINLILKSLPISLFTLSLDNMHYTKWISDNVQLLTGFSADNFMEKNDFWMERVHPEDLTKIMDLSNYVNGININEHRWLCADGQYQWFLNYALIKTDENGNPKEVIGTWQNIHERKLSEDKIHHSEEQLRSLANHLESIREEERNKIAREVHDEFGQSLTALKMITLSIKKKLSKENKELAEKAKDMAELISSIIQSVQKITSELRPQVLESIGLLEALEWYFGEFQSRTRINCSIEISVDNSILFDDKQSITIYRIFQEALTNIARHSNAKRVKVSIKSEDNLLYIKIEDNGKGLDISKINDPKSFGIIGMKERAITLGGEVLFGSIKNKGTTIVLKVPVLNHLES